MTKVNYKRATITRTRSLNKFDSYPRRAQEPWVSPKGVISALLSLFRQVYILCFLIQQENHELLGKKNSNLSRRFNWKESPTLP
jgi:hypothetical protein